jgi:hypothetical protein
MARPGRLLLPTLAGKRDCDMHPGSRRAERALGVPPHSLTPIQFKFQQMHKSLYSVVVGSYTANLCMASVVTAATMAA